MNDSARQKLTDLLAEYGPALCKTSSATDQVIRQALADHPDELAAILLALDRAIAKDIWSQPGPATPARLTAWTDSLCQAGLSPADARWTIDAWAHALQKGPDAHEPDPAIAPGVWDEVRTTFRVCAIVALVGVVLLCAGLFFFLIRLSYLADGVETDGVVIRLEELRGRRGSRTYAPVVQYQAAGQSIVFRDSVSSNPPAYTLGERVRLVYLPASPQNAVLNTTRDMVLAPVLLGAFGLVVVLAAVGYLLHVLKQHSIRLW